MNPATALAVVLVDELIRCGLAEAVVAPGSRSAPLALELYRRAQAGDLRLHVRIDERSAAFCALGLAKASRRPAAVVCTSGSAAAHLHAAAIEADESAVPLLLLTADRPPELRGTGSNQTVDQLKLFGGVVRWFCELGVPEAGAGGGAEAGALAGQAANGYWRSAASRAWALASGAGGAVAGPVHLNLPLREPLVPGPEDVLPGAGAEPWPAELAGRPGRRPWISFAPVAEVDWAERGLIICGDGDYDAGPLLELAARAGWPVLAEPSSNARRGPNALRAYQYLLANPAFTAGHQPDVLISAGRPGLSRGQLALVRAGGRTRHVVLAQGPGRWADPGRSATDVAAAVRLAGGAGGGGWLGSWLAADAAARAAADRVLDASAELSEPRLARDLAAALPDGALLWVASSLPVRDLDQHLAPREGLRILASRGASGIDGIISSAIGAALAHQRAGGGPAFALLGDLSVLHDAPGLLFGAAEPRPDLCLIVTNNDGGGIFSMLEQAAIPGPFERIFGTPHGTGFEQLAAAAGVPWRRIETAAELTQALSWRPGRDGRESGSGAGRAGLRLVELRTERSAQADLRTRISGAVAAALPVAPG